MIAAAEWMFILAFVAPPAVLLLGVVAVIVRGATRNQAAAAGAPDAAMRV